MQRRETDWRTVLLAIGAAGGAVLAFGAAAVLVLYSALDLTRLQLLKSGRADIQTAVAVGTLTVIGMAFLPALFYSMRRLLGGEVPAAKPGRLRIWQAVLLILAWLGAAAGAGFLFDKPIVKWVTPILYALAICVPVYFFVRLATGGLNPGSRERLWGALAAGIGLGITPAMVAELLLALVALVGVGIYVSLHPEQLAALQRLVDQLKTSNDIEQVLTLAGPLLTSPFALLLALVFFSVLSPLIEEIAKSLTTWAVFDRLKSPAQGFAIGAISGAAFGLVESLLVSATPDIGWTSTLLVRGASTMMHIMSASLTGWGIAALRTQKSVGRLIGLYALAIGLHGAWNASVVVITFGSVRSALSPGRPDPVGLIMMYLGAAVLAVLCLAIPLAMAGINWRFRRLAEAAALWHDVSVPSESPADVETRNQAEGVPSPPAPLL